jgi:hypothetical protein
MRTVVARRAIEPPVIRGLPVELGVPGGVGYPMTWARSVSARARKRLRAYPNDPLFSDPPCPDTEVPEGGITGTRCFPQVWSLIAEKNRIAPHPDLGDLCVLAREELLPSAEQIPCEIAAVRGLFCIRRASRVCWRADAGTCIRFERGLLWNNRQGAGS